MPLFDAENNELAVGQLVLDRVFDETGRVEALGGDSPGQEHAGHVRVHHG